MRYPDMGTVCGAERGNAVRAVGWLEAGHPFPKGEVPPTFLTKLRFHIRNAYQPVTLFGVHFCGLCPDAEEKGLGGSGNLWIPTRDVVFVAPELVEHYIVAHRYKPPAAFQDALMGCPTQGSPEFMALLHKHLPHHGPLGEGTLTGDEDHFPVRDEATVAGEEERLPLSNEATMAEGWDEETPVE
ncbi:MAG: hypothetical protein AB2A00_31050 [Myxococcota bacterium]